MKIYISGPMSSRPHHNFPAFNDAAARLRAAGYDVVNPADTGIVDGWSWSDYLRLDLRLLSECDGIARLDGWSSSRGALLELYVADELDMQIADVDEWIWDAS